MEITFTEPGNGFKDDLKKIVKPNEGKQTDFASLPNDIFEALFGGAAYGGKSFILTTLPLIMGWYKFEGFRGILFRKHFPDLEKEIIRLSKIYYPVTGATYNEQKHTWEWRAFHSYMDFGHIQHDSNIVNYDSSQYNYCGFDELTHFGPFPYHYMVGSRVRPSSRFNLAIVRNGTNPGGIGQTWVYKRFVEPAEDGGIIIRDRGTGLLRTFIRALIEDNPYGLEFDPEYANKLKILEHVDPALYKAKRYGDWHAFKGSVFTTFRPIRFPGEPDNALHVVEPFEIPKWWTRILSIDWGKRAMCYALWGAISPDRRLYLYRERSWYGKDIPYWASEIREINTENGEDFASVILCGSAWQDRGSETIASQFQKYSGLVPSSSENNAGSRIAGLQVVHDFLRWERRTTLKSAEEFYDIKKAQQIYRLYGPEALEQYKALFFDEPEESNLPVLQIFDKLSILIDTIPMAVYAENKTNGKPAEDIAEFDGDDPLDDLRYMCRAARRFMLGEMGNLKRQEELANIIGTLEKTNDMTKFYRQMELHEAKMRNSNTGMITVSRRSRFGRRH